MKNQHPKIPAHKINQTKLKFLRFFLSQFFSRDIVLHLSKMETRKFDQSTKPFTQTLCALDLAIRGKGGHSQKEIPSLLKKLAKQIN